MVMNGSKNYSLHKLTTMSLILNWCDGSLVSPIDSCWHFNVSGSNECYSFFDSAGHRHFVDGVLAAFGSVESIKSLNEFIVQHVSIFVEFQFVADSLLMIFGVVLGDFVTILKVNLVTKLLFASLVLFVMLDLQKNEKKYFRESFDNIVKWV